MQLGDLVERFTGGKLMTNREAADQLTSYQHGNQPVKRAGSGRVGFVEVQHVFSPSPISSPGGSKVATGAGHPLTERTRNRPRAGPAATEFYYRRIRVAFGGKGYDPPGWPAGVTAKQI